jgi:hypothetical protein
VVNTQTKVKLSTSFLPLTMRPQTSSSIRPVPFYPTASNKARRTSPIDPSAPSTAAAPTANQKNIVPSPNTKPTFSPPVFVTNAGGNQTICVTFTTTVTPISRSSAKYTFVQRSGTTVTSNATNISMSTRDSTKPPTSTKPSNPQRSPDADADPASDQDTA